jgi:hypothetical protein
MFRLFRKKKQISMTEFANQIREIAKANNEDYFTIDYRHCETSTGKTQSFTAYIHGFDHASADTPEQAVEIMRQGIAKKKGINKIQEVIV